MQANAEQPKDSRHALQERELNSTDYLGEKLTSGKRLGLGTVLVCYLASGLRNHPCQSGQGGRRGNDFYGVKQRPLVLPFP
ncbi:hypothetical protein GN956_G18749 [Arapaima gigas]